MHLDSLQKLLHCPIEMNGNERLHSRHLLGEALFRLLTTDKNKQIGFHGNASPFGKQHGVINAV